MGETDTNSTGWLDKKVFTTGEAAQVCKVSQQTIIRCFASGRLQGFRVPGSRFRRIPREELLRFMRQNSIPLDALEGASKRILVVEDDERIGSLIERLLTRDGRFEVHLAATGYDAGILTERNRPHLIVLDYMLPDINGNVVCERVRAMEGMDDTKIIIVSGVVDREDIEQLLSAGADDFLQKPFDIAELIKRVEKLLAMESPAGGSNGAAS